MQSAPVPIFLRFFYEHGLHSVRHLLECLNQGMSITELARIFDMTPSKMRRVVHAITEVKYIVREELLDWIESELDDTKDTTETARRYRAKILQLASLNGKRPKQNGR